MRRLFFLAAVVAGLSLVATASGKGPVAGTIDGPGAGGGISLGGGGEPGGVMAVADQAGFFAAAFGQTPSPMLAGRPGGDLGPRYTITYVVPGGPNGKEDLIRQDLYPYAAGSPVTYTPAGQTLFGTRRTIGGWYRAAPELKAALVRAGLPASAPSESSTGGGGSFDERWLVLGVALALGLALTTVLVVRRRPRTAAT